MATLAARLTQALELRGLSDRALARKVRHQGGTVTHAYIGRLASGTADNPTLSVISMLAKALDVPVGWLAGDEAPAISPNLDDAALNLAARANGLSDVTIDMLIAMVEAARKAEGLAGTEKPGHTGQNT